MTAFHQVAAASEPAATRRISRFAVAAWTDRQAYRPSRWTSSQNDLSSPPCCGEPNAGPTIPAANVAP